MDLVLSLGHNSSAILIEDGVIVAGYEEERFTGVKADSRFPKNAIMALYDRFAPGPNTDVHVGHWFLNAELPGPNKYWDPELLRSLFPKGQVYSLNADFTHHDSHLMSAMAFARDQMPERYHVAVMDGFGSFGECISLYEVNYGSWRIIDRVFGFDKSLGMLYQYATAFMGMKMHNHEYKMLAYEVHIHEYFDEDEIIHLTDMADEAAVRWLRAIHNQYISKEFDPIVNIEALPQIQANVNARLTNVLEEMGVHYDDTNIMRTTVSYYVQRLVEQVAISMVRLINPTNLMVVGGLFYNVKLNSLLADMVPGKFCAMPLAGDQGAGIGVYAAHKGFPKWPENLTWGVRNLDFGGEYHEGIINVNSMDDALPILRDELQKIGVVNLVRGAMEFGPRALCNTSTLAIPTKEIAETINRINDRTMEMPFAPVMTEAQVHEYFEDTDKIVKSLEYMIITRKYRKTMGERVLGAAHRYPDGTYTGRPQLTRDKYIVALLEEFGPLINTSFNFHGVPIVHTRKDIVFTHESQRKTAFDVRVKTIVVKE